MHGSLGRWVRWLSAPFPVADSHVFIGPPLQVADACARRWSGYLIGIFDQIIVGHGAVVENKGKEVFRTAFRWLLK